MQSVDWGGEVHSMHTVTKRSPLHSELRGCAAVYSVCLETSTDNLSYDKLSNSLVWSEILELRLSVDLRSAFVPFEYGKALSCCKKKCALKG